MLQELINRFVHPVRVSALIGLLPMLALLLIPGCGEPRAAPVDVELARATLTDVLEHWKAGGTIGQLRERTPEIVVQEAIWANGRRLLEFAPVDDGWKEDANWYCEVELTLVAEDGNEPDRKKVTYVVGTDPILTVFHAML